MLISCAVTIEVVPDGAVISLPQLEQCEGVEVLLTVHQTGHGSQSVLGTVSNGQVKFESRDLSRFDFSGRFSFELRILSKSDTCPFPRYKLFIANNEKLTPTNGDSYEISASKFK